MSALKNDKMKLFPLVFLFFLLNGCAHIVTSHDDKLMFDGRYEEVIQRYESAHESERYSTKQLVHNVCKSYLYRNRIDDTLQCLQEAELKYNSGDTNAYPYTMGSGYLDALPLIEDIRGQIYLNTGDYTSAVAHLEKAYQLALRKPGQKRGRRTNSGSNSSLTIISKNLATAYFLAGEHEKAQETSDTSIEYARANRNSQYRLAGLISHPAMELGTLMHEVELEFALHDYHKVVELVQGNRIGTDDIVVMIGPGSGRIYSWLRTPEINSMEKSLNHLKYLQAKSLMKLKRYGESIPLYLQLLREENLMNQADVRINCYADLSTVYVALGDLAQAVEYGMDAVEKIEIDGKTIPYDNLRISFSAKHQQVYGDLIRLLIENAEIEKAFEYLERAKSYALVTMLNHETVGSLDALLQSPAGNDNGPVSEVSYVTVDEIKRAVRDNEVILEYFPYKNDLFIFKIDHSEIQLIKTANVGLSSLVREMRACLDSGGNIEVFDRISEKLSDSLVEPVGRLGGYDDIAIIPHGVLHYLPFSVLKNNGEFLLQAHSIRQLPSSTVKYYLAARKTGKAERIVLFGNPDLGSKELDLPGAEREIHRIAELYEDPALYVRGNASETEITSPRNYPSKMLHIASHARFDVHDPLGSAIYLAKDSENDGKLTVRELYGARVPAELVVLSGCQTGVSRLTGGDELIGFVRGFLFAGAKRLVVSHWEVSDESTAELMKKFHEYHMEGLEPQQALRMAQLELMKLYPHPYHWAAFYCL